MINVKITDKNNKFEVLVEGHAAYDDKGYDIVCASASTAINIIVNSIDNLGYNIENYQEKNGYVKFNCEKNEITSGLIKTLIEHFGVLNEDYPDFVKITK